MDFRSDRRTQRYPPSGVRVVIRASTLAALAFAMSSVPAMADSVPLPSIDGARYCNAVSGFLNASSPGADLIRDGCLKTESDYSEKLRRAWPKVSEDDRSQCLRLLALVQPSNQGLAGCLILALG
jgi:hypothetical protein